MRGWFVMLHLITPPLQGLSSCLAATLQGKRFGRIQAKNSEMGETGKTQDSLENDQSPN